MRDASPAPSAGAPSDDPPDARPEPEDARRPAGTAAAASIPTTAWREQLDDAERERFASGDLDAVISSTRARGRHDLSARVRELVWDFAGAAEDWRSIGALVDALRCAIEAGRSAQIDDLLVALRVTDSDQRRAAVALLERRGRRADAASITVEDDADDVLRRARALASAGDPLAAATLLHASGRAREALSLLGRLDERESHAARWVLAAQLHWSLGDAEGTIRAAQAARRLGVDDEAGARLLARALGSLGHDIAGELVLGSIPRTDREETPALHGRYRVTRLADAPLVGVAYHAVDRATLQEVEVHLLLGERGEREDPDGRVRATLERFAAAAEGASRLGHPAIRPLHYVDPRLGVLILPRAAGPALDRHLTAQRPVPAVQARAWIAFLLDGLAAAHARGIVHGGPFPSSLVEDALGRPMLGPFGVDALAGLAVTRTATLQELLAFSAPERRDGGEATPQSDVWSLGRLLAALTLGTVEIAKPQPLLPPKSPSQPEPSFAPRSLDLRGLRDLEPELAAIVAALCHPEPSRRPSATEARSLVAAQVHDATRLSGPSLRGASPAATHADTAAADREAPDAAAGASARRGQPARTPTVGGVPAVEVVAASSWSDAALDGLTRLRAPSLQPILDRDGRTLFLAGWPEGSALAPPDLELPVVLSSLRSAYDPDADATSATRAVLEQRLAILRHEAVVRTPSGEWFIALDALLRQ